MTTEEMLVSLDENVKNVVINTWSKNDMKSFIDKILNSNECNLYL